MKQEKTSVQKMPSSIVDAQLQRLLEIVEEFKTKQCEILLEQASQKSKQVVNHSYHNARTRLHLHILEERQQLQQSLAAVRAKQHTFVMQQKHQASRQLLNDSWELLTSKLVQRWKNPDQRKLWVQSVVDVAMASLPADEWQIEYGAEWEKPEQKQLLDYIAEHSDRKVTVKTGSDIVAIKPKNQKTPQKQNNRKIFFFIID